MRHYLDIFMMRVLSKKSILFIFLCLIMIILLRSSGCDQEVSPPDLNSCTHLQIRYPLSTLNYFLPSSDLQYSVLSQDEKKYIQSIEFFKVKDLERIKEFAHDVSLGTYDGHLWGRVFDADPVATIECYRYDKQIVSFMVCGNMIITEDKRLFKYPKGLPDIKTIEPEEMQPFKLRYQCGLNMQRIYTAGPLSRHKKVTSYPEATEWCDVIMRDRVNTLWVNDEKMNESFKCPAVGKGRCHYALNPHCKPNSSPDTVLLFETKAGWNKHGGPELFSFDDHDPKGGCILLNNGKVKFIRTKKELQQLQWE